MNHCFVLGVLNQRNNLKHARHRPIEHDLTYGIPTKNDGVNTLPADGDNDVNININVQNKAILRML